MVPWWSPQAAMWWVEEREEWFILDVKTCSPGPRAQSPGSGAVCSLRSQRSAGTVWSGTMLRKGSNNHQPFQKSKIGSLLSSKWIQVPLSLLSWSARTQSCQGGKSPKMCPVSPPSPHGVALLTSSLWEVDWLSQSGGRSLRPVPLFSLLLPVPWILHAQIQKASWQEPSAPQGSLHPLWWEGVTGDRRTVPTHPLVALVYQRCHVQNELVWVRMKLATAVAQHRRQTTQFSQVLSFLPVTPSPAFPPGSGSPVPPQSAASFACEFLWARPRGFMQGPTYPPSHWPPPNCDWSSLSPGIRGIMRVPLGFFCATSAEDIKALILKASQEPFLFLRHLSRGVASNRRRIKEAGLSGLELFPRCCQCPSRKEAQRIWEVKRKPEVAIFHLH